MAAISEIRVACNDSNVARLRAAPAWYVAMRASVGPLAVSAPSSVRLKTKKFRAVGVPDVFVADPDAPLLRQSKPVDTLREAPVMLPLVTAFPVADWLIVLQRRSPSISILEALVEDAAAPAGHPVVGVPVQ